MSGPVEIDRRVTLQWMLAAMAAGAAPMQGAYAAPATSGPWPSTTPDPVKGPGYGTDPNLLEPVVPWPKSLSASQLQTACQIPGEKGIRTLTSREMARTRWGSPHHLGPAKGANSNVPPS